MIGVATVIRAARRGVRRRQRRRRVADRLIERFVFRVRHWRPGVIRILDPDVVIVKQPRFIRPACADNESPFVDGLLRRSHMLWWIFGPVHNYTLPQLFLSARASFSAPASV